MWTVRDMIDNRQKTSDYDAERWRRDARRTSIRHLLRCVTGAAVILIIGVTVGWGLWTVTELAAQECKAAGGSIRSLSGSGIGISSSGSVVPTFTTTTVCMSPDGRILE